MVLVAARLVAVVVEQVVVVVATWYVSMERYDKEAIL